MGRNARKRAERQASQREKRASVPKGAVVRSTPSNDKPERLTDLRQLTTEACAKAGVQLSDPPTCSGFKEVKGRITDTPCSKMLEPADIKRGDGMCGHHKHQAAAPAEPTTDDPPEAEGKVIMAHDKAATKPPPTTIDPEKIREKLDRPEFDWGMIEALELPTGDAFEELTPEGAQAVFDRIAELRRRPVGDGPYRPNPDADGFDYMQKPHHVHYSSLIEGDAQASHPTDEFESNLDKEEPQRSISHDLFHYLRAVLVKSAYVPSNLGDATRLTYALAEGRKTLPELIANREKGRQQREQAAQAAVARGQSLAERLRTEQQQPKTVATNGSGEHKGEEAIAAEINEALMAFVDVADKEQLADLDNWIGVLQRFEGRASGALIMEATLVVVDIVNDQFEETA